VVDSDSCSCKSDASNLVLVSQCNSTARLSTFCQTTNNIACQHIVIEEMLANLENFVLR
jgi:hypothetical protein